MTQDETLDMVAVAADDAALGLLARGEAVGGDDPAFALLAALRADLDATAAAPRVPAAPRRRDHTAGKVLAVAACAALLGTATVAALQAEPGNPLYPVREIVAGGVESDAERADRLLDEAVLAMDEVKDSRSRTALGVATRAIAQARAAIVALPAGDGRALLTRRADRLQRELDALRGALTPVPRPSASPSDDSGGDVDRDDRTEPGDDRDDPDDPDEDSSGSGSDGDSSGSGSDGDGDNSGKGSANSGSGGDSSDD